MGVETLSAQSDPPGVQRSDHLLLRDDAVAAIDEVCHRFPIETVIGPQADPLSSSIRRLEELLSHQEALDVLRLEAEGNRRTSLDVLEGDEDLLARLEIWMPP